MRSTKGNHKGIIQSTYEISKTQIFKKLWERDEIHVIDMFIDI